jgi:flagellar biosynthesis protein FlhF
MKIKSFTAKSYREALELVKKEFGPDAVIMETQEIKEGDYLVKITAAIDFEENSIVTKKEDYFNSYLESELMEDKETQIDTDLRQEIREIKNLLLEMKFQGKLNNNDKYEFLKKLGIKEDFMEALLDYEEVEDLYEKITSEIKGGYRLANGKTIMLVGPTGAGKTTTIVKLASFAVKIGKKVGIINLDNFRLGAYEQLRVFTQLLGIPLTTVNDLDELKSVYEEFSKDKSIVFIDTTGRNPKDKRYISELNKVRDYGLPIEIHLTVSLSMQDDIFIRSKENYQSLGIDYLVFTKLDEAYNFGSIYNIYKAYGKPISYLTNGQRIPNDIQAVSPTKLTNIILGRGLVQ